RKPPDANWITPEFRPVAHQIETRVRVPCQGHCLGQLNDYLFVRLTCDRLLELADCGAKLHSCSRTKAAVTRQEGINRELKIFAPLRGRKFGSSGSGCGTAVVLCANR